MDEQRIADIVHRVLGELQNQPASAPASSGHTPTCMGGAVSGGRDGVFENIEDAIAAAKRAFQQFRVVPLNERKKYIKLIREVSHQHNDEWSRFTIQDTKMGRVDHKILKNGMAANLTPGVEDLETLAVTGSRGLMMEEYAPFGVIGTITPTTNPVATVINHSIAMLSAGNTIVFGPHPNAVACTLQSMQVINRALTDAGAPANLMTSVAEPSLRTAKTIMTHDDISLLVVTGGPAVVRAAMESPKRAIVAGPGNPPAVVDETADIQNAAVSVYEGSCFDNNLPCITEKSCFVVSSVFDEFISAIRQRGAYLLDRAQTETLTRALITPDNHVNKDYIGKDAAVVAQQALGLSVPANCELLIAEVDRNHPYIVHEMMIPVLGMVRVNSYEEAIQAAFEAEHGFGHTAIIHSRRIDRITEFARLMNCNLFVANASCGACLGNGGEGYTAFTIAGKSGEGPCTPKTFSRKRRFAIAKDMRFV
ncbi:MAG: aldehyde dehydrogenase EutE [Candidatus Hinthialibacter antarcticus]|nr:aldehyde dehydrogenase EutE [Candidatus Hinthialibacter antarcticus]